MSTPARVNFTVKTNEHFIRTWQITNNGNPFDVTGYTFELEIRNGKGVDAPRILNLVSGDGITTTDAALGKIQITIPPQTQIKKQVTYQYDLLAIKDGISKVWLEGTFTFELGVSFSGV